MDLTPEEKQFLLNLLRQTSISPMAQDAAKTVAIVQAISEKLK